MKDDFKGSGSPQDDDHPEYSPKYDVDYTTNLDDQVIKGETQFFLDKFASEKLERRYSKLDTKGLSWEQNFELREKLRNEIKGELINLGVQLAYEKLMGKDALRKKRSHYHKHYKGGVWPRKKASSLDFDCE